MRHPILALVSFLSLLLPAVASATPATDADVEAYLTATGADATEKQMMAQIAAKMPSDPETTRKLMAVLNEEMPKARAFKVPVYKKYFTHEDFQEIQRFYASPVGKKLSAAGPRMAVEMSQASQAWSQNLMSRVMAVAMASAKARAANAPAKPAAAPAPAPAQAPAAKAPQGW